MKNILMWIGFFVPKVLRVCGNFQFGLFEHFVEQRKIEVITFVPNLRVSIDVDDFIVTNLTY